MSNIATEKIKTGEITPIPDGLAEKIDKMKLFSELLPFKFGRSALEGMSINCAGCGIEINLENIRGSIEVVGDGHTAAVQAFALCYGCRTISPVDVKFHDDGSAIFKSPNGWVNGKWDALPVGVLTKARTFLTDKWKQIIPPSLAAVVVVTWIACHS